MTNYLIGTKPSATLLFLLISSSVFGLSYSPPPEDSVKKIVLTYDNLINELSFNEILNLFDEQDSVGDPLNGNGGYPQTECGVIHYGKLFPNSFIIDLKTFHDSVTLFACDNSGQDNDARVFIGHPGSWTRASDLYLGGTNYNWPSVSLPDSTRFIRIQFEQYFRANEISVYGRNLGSGASPTAPGILDSTRLEKPDYGNYFMGACGFYDDPDTLMIPVGSTMRQYIPWDYLEWKGVDTALHIADTSYQGYPNSTFRFSPNRFNANMDNIYTNWKNQGIDVVPVLQQMASYLRDGRKSTAKPITIGDDPEDPQSYEEHADFMYQFTARYGRTQQADSLLKLDSTQSRVSGLDLINFVENWNEPDNWWTDSASFFRPEELAAMCSADYDGHEGALGNTYGVKNADSTMKMVMGGLAVIEVGYIQAMKTWSDYNRTSGFPADVINVHHYSNNGGKQRHDDSTAVGVSPEDDDLKGRLKKIVEYRDLWLPDVEVWITEFGYSTHPDSKQRSPAIGSNSEEEIQGRWLLRSFLEISAAGVDRAHQYLLVDQKTELSTFYAADGLVKDRWNHTNPYYIWENGAIVDTVYHEHESFEKKKSWYYTACMKNVMNGFRFHQELNSGHEDVNLYEFRSENGDSSVFAIWSKTSTNQILNNFKFNIGNNTYAASVTTPDSISRIGITQSLSLLGDSVALTVSELPRFILKVHTDSIFPTAIAQNIIVYLDENGSATITPDDIDNGSYDNNGVNHKSISKSSFNCLDVSASSTGLVVNSDSSWLTSSVEGKIKWATFPWAGVEGVFPDDSTFSPSLVGQPHGWKSMDPVDDADVLKCGNYVSFHKKTFSLNNTTGLKSRFQITDDDDLEIYVNGHLLARDDEYNGSKGRDFPYHDVYFADSTTNGYDGGDEFNYVKTTGLDSIFKVGQNTILVAVRNGAPGSTGGAGNIGGFSFKMTLEQEGIPVTLTVSDHVNNSDSATAFVQVLDTLPPDVITKDKILYLDANGNATLNVSDINNGTTDNCDSLNLNLSRSPFTCSDISGFNSISIISDSTWLKSSETRPRAYPWSGLTESEIPHDTTFTLAAEEGQVYTYEHVQPVSGSKAIKANSNINVFKKSFFFDANDDYEAVIEITGDDFFQVLINGTPIGLRNDVGNPNRQNPPHTVYYAMAGTSTNGYNGGDSFDTFYSGDLRNILKTGENTIVVAVSNKSVGGQGGFSFKMELSGFQSSTVSLIAEDKFGNTSSAPAFVKVLDTISPVVVPRDRSYSLGFNSVLNLDPNDLDSSSSDNCAIESITLIPSSLSCEDHGSNSIQMSVIDSSGNIGVAYLTVVLDTAGGDCDGYSAKKGSNDDGFSDGDLLEDLANFKNESISLFPNPSGDQFKIDSPNEIEELLIFDSSAKLVLKLKAIPKNEQIDVSKFPNGVYLVRVKDKYGWTPLKLVKE